jgi:hypothetical protein
LSLTVRMAARIGFMAGCLPYFSARTNSHLPRAQRFLQIGSVSPSLNCAGVLHTLHQ